VQPTIVTPEAVVVGLEVAGLPTRLLARVVDLVIQVAQGIAAGFALGFLGASLSTTAAIVIGLFALFGLLFGYTFAFEALWRGRTPGKALLGLRVVTAEGAPIRLRHALIRSAADLVDVYLFYGVVGVVTMALSKRTQRLGDLIAGTIVLRERVAAKAPTVQRFVVPPGWEAYAATVDVSGLGADDVRAVRSFLVRAPQLRPEARAELATSLATAVAARARHVPPAGVTPEQLLLVVAANVQARAAGVAGPLPVVPSAAPPWPAPPGPAAAADQPTGGGFTAPS
jgi:uncharacterized RDD family membrane protein YckC